jgi:hypothetical protein
MLFMKDVTTFTAPLQMDFAQVFLASASDSALFFRCVCTSVLKEFLILLRSRRT